MVVVDDACKGIEPLYNATTDSFSNDTHGACSHLCIFCEFQNSSCLTSTPGQYSKLCSTTGRSGNPLWGDEGCMHGCPHVQHTTAATIGSRLELCVQGQCLGADALTAVHVDQAGRGSVVEKAWEGGNEGRSEGNATRLQPLQGVVLEVCCRGNAAPGQYPSSAAKGTLLLCSILLVLQRDRCSCPVSF